jgi:hypothetical protein
LNGKAFSRGLEVFVKRDKNDSKYSLAARVHSKAEAKTGGEKRWKSC